MCTNHRAYAAWVFKIGCRAHDVKEWSSNAQHLGTTCFLGSQFLYVRGGRKSDSSTYSSYLKSYEQKALNVNNNAQKHVKGTGNGAFLVRELIQPSIDISSVNDVVVQFACWILREIYEGFATMIFPTN